MSNMLNEMKRSLELSRVEGDIVDAPHSAQQRLNDYINLLQQQSNAQYLQQMNQYQQYMNRSLQNYVQGYGYGHPSVIVPLKGAL